jgi:hypothetical protein
MIRKVAESILNKQSLSLRLNGGRGIRVINVGLGQIHWKT